jgi:hypothetical protein
MEIEFNTGRLARTEAGQPTAKRAAASDAAAAVSFSKLDALKGRLAAQPATRPEAVARAKELVADENYPPDYVLDRVAVLLAVHAKTGSAASSDPSGQAG